MRMRTEIRSARCADGTVIKVRGPGGFGDACYMASIVYHLRNRTKEKIGVMSNFSGLFGEIADVEVFPYCKESGWVKRSYSVRRDYKETSQWQDLLMAYDLPVDLPLFYPLQIKKIRRDRPIMICSLPHKVFGFDEMFPEDIYTETLKKNKGKYCVIGIGTQDDAEIECDEIRKDLTPLEVCSFVASADRVLGQCGWIIPFAERFEIPGEVLFSKRLNNGGGIHRLITPEKVIHRKDLLCGEWV